MTQHSNVSMRTIPASGYIAERIERFKNSTVAATSIDKSLFIATLADILEVVKGNEELLAWTPFAERRPPDPEDGERRFLEVGVPCPEESGTFHWLYLFTVDDDTNEWTSTNDNIGLSVDEAIERGMTHWRYVHPPEGAPATDADLLADWTDEELVDQIGAPAEVDQESIRAEILRRMSKDELKKEVDELKAALRNVPVEFEPEDDEA